MGMLRYPWIGCVVLAMAVVGAAADGQSDSDWLATWQRMPVLHEGRIKPVDTFARQVVEAVCGRQSPWLGLDSAVAEDGTSSRSPERAEARKLFPGGKPRKFSSAELLLSWIVEPQRWERVPLLNASNQELRRDLLELSIEGPGGVRLKYASPWQVQRAEKFHARWDAILEEQRKARSEEKAFQATGLDRAVSQLAEAYSIYRFVSFHPDTPNGTRRQLLDRLSAAAQAWRDLEPDLKQLPPPDGYGGADEVAAVSDALKQLFTLAVKAQGPPWIPLEQADSLVVKLRQAAAALPGRVEAIARRFAESPPEADRSQWEQVRVRLRAMAAGADHFVRLCHELHLALYDYGHTLAIVPALNVAALEQDRDPNRAKQRETFGRDRGGVGRPSPSAEKESGDESPHSKIGGRRHFPGRGRPIS